MARDHSTITLELGEAHDKERRLQQELDELTRSAGGVENLDEGQMERADRLMRGIDNARGAANGLRNELVDLVRSAAGRPGNREAGSVQSPELMRRVNPWDEGNSDVISRANAAAERLPGLPDEGRERLQALVADEEAPAARAILALANPDYLTAFRSIIRDPDHGHRMWNAAELDAYQSVMRTGLSLSNTNGGYLVPLTLDPTVLLTNAGIAGSIREYANHKTTATNTWQGVTSAGVTAEWTAEAAVMADATPTFGQILITPHKADAYVFGSFEVLGDSNFSDQLAKLIADAKKRIEEAAFATGAGDGSNTPWGVITRVTAVTASRVSATHRRQLRQLDRHLQGRQRDVAAGRGQRRVDGQPLHDQRDAPVPEVHGCDRVHRQRRRQRADDAGQAAHRVLDDGHQHHHRQQHPAGR